VATSTTKIDNVESTFDTNILFNQIEMLVLKTIMLALRLTMIIHSPMRKKTSHCILKYSFHPIGGLISIWKSLFAILLASLISQAATAKDTLVIAVGLTKPPYVIQADNSGFEIELIRDVLAIMGKSAKFVYTSFGHSSKMLAVDGVDAVMTTSNKMIHDETKLTNTYIIYENVAISLKKNDFSIESPHDLSNYSIASFQKADKFLGLAFKMAVKQSPYFLEIADQRRQPILLLKKRVDVVVMDKNIFNYFAQELKVEKPENKFSFHHIFPKNHYKMAFKDTQNTINFNKALFKYAKSDAFKALFKKYKLQPYKLNTH